MLGGGGKQKFKKTIISHFISRFMLFPTFIYLGGGGGY